MLGILEFFAVLYASLIDVLGGWGHDHLTSIELSKRLSFFNTLSGAKERFSTIKPRIVKMYNCGPTVYGPQHIGNLSMFVFVDILRRTLEYNGYAVQQVINFTDVGHLTGDNEGDADAGEDRMTKGLMREGMALTLDNMRALGKKYADLFLADLVTLNVKTEDTKFPRASDFIQEQIEMVRVLEQKGYAYTGASGVYFDTSRFPSYGVLGNIDLSSLKAGARVVASTEKRNPTDFLLWKRDSKMGWDSPWGMGFPGWHIECSAMIRALLGDQIDIHTGGIEHIPIHHNNEIAQSEAATGKVPFSRFWLHRAHLQIEGAKIAKSVGNTIFVGDIVEAGFPPLALRYLLLGAHYRTPASFSWESLKAAQTSLYRIYNLYDSFKDSNGTGKNADAYEKRFIERINDDLDTPGALATLWEMTRDAEIRSGAKYYALKKFDSVLGLSIAEEREIPREVLELMEKREEARRNKDWKTSDEIREKVKLEWNRNIEDTPEGPRASMLSGN